MNRDPHETLMEVLTIIGYEGDKFKFAKKFSALCYYQACWDLVGKLSPVDQEKIKRDVPKDVSPLALKSMLSQWFGDGDYESAYSEASRCVFLDCFKSMISMLSDSAQDRLRQLLGNK